MTELLGKSHCQVQMRCHQREGIHAPRVRKAVCSFGGWLTAAAELTDWPTAKDFNGLLFLQL